MNRRDPKLMDAVRRRMDERQPPGMAARLAEMRVGVAGCGGLGSHAAMALARLGVGELVLVDFDHVEPSNLNRQLYRLADLGKPKARVLARELRRANPFIRVKARVARLTADTVAGMFGGCGAVLECLDRAEAKAEMVTAALRDLPGTWVVAASGLAGLGDGNTLRTRRCGPRLWLVGDGAAEATPENGLAAPRVMAAAGLQALAAARLLLGLEADGS